MLAKKPRLSGDDENDQNIASRYESKLEFQEILKKYQSENVMKVFEEINKTGASKPSNGISSSEMTATVKKAREDLQRMKAPKSSQKSNGEKNTGALRKSRFIPLTGISSSEMSASVQKAIEDLQRMKSAKSSRKSSVVPSAKNCTTARKELFKMPAKPRYNIRKSIERPSLGKIPIPNSRLKSKKAVDSSPLLNMTQAEDLILKNKAYPFTSPRTPTYQFSLNLSSIEETEIAKTPESNSELTSSTEFLEMEKLCNITTPTVRDSPISTVCTMLENKMQLASVKKPKNTDSQTNLITYIETLKEILESHKMENIRFKKAGEEILNNYKKLFEQNQRKNEENMCKMTDLITKLELLNNNPKVSEKENSSGTTKRRSLRLLSKSPLKPTRTANISPAITKAGDLRKSTLTKSLVSKCEKYQIDSPRIRRAVNLYNSTRQICSGLTTPKTDRKALTESARTNVDSWRNTLSQKVQDQCIMLQDTPRHH